MILYSCDFVRKANLFMQWPRNWSSLKYVLLSEEKKQNGSNLDNRESTGRKGKTVQYSYVPFLAEDFSFLADLCMALNSQNNWLIY